MTGQPRTGPRLGARADQHTVRDHNLALVLQHVAIAEGSSRARLAEATGLNKTTVSSLVSELMQRRLVTETGVHRSGDVGRPAVQVRLDGDSYVAVGMEVNVDYLATAIVDLRGRVRDQRFVVADNRNSEPGPTLARLAVLLQQGLDDVNTRELVPVGANLALPGLVDASRHNLLVAPNLGWRDVAMTELLHTHLPMLDFDILIDNEANLAALAERWRGAGRRYHDFLHVSGEVGVGAGIIIDGSLHRGATGFGGEFGHMNLRPDGPRCGCGNRGCVETYVGLLPMLKLAGFDVEQTLVGASMADVGPAADIARAAAVDDPRALAALEEVGRLLGVALASAVNLLSPEAIILGGYLAPLTDWLGPAIREELARRVLSGPHREMAVVTSHLQRGAAVRGAAELVVRQVLAHPGTVSAVA